MVDGAWLDITSDVLTRDDIVITRGRAEAAQHTDRGTCTLTLNNTNGKYSPRNTRSPYYGKIGRNTPLRVLVGDSVRFVGEVSSWPPRWDVSGTDLYVPIEASGILRRLQQGARPLKSALFRTLSDIEPFPAYWPLEDSPGSRQAASCYSLGSPMQATGDVTFTGEPANGVGGSVSVGRGGRLYGPVSGSTSSWFVAFWLDVPSDLGVGESTPLVRWYTPGSDVIDSWSFRVRYHATYRANWVVETWDAQGQLIDASAPAIDPEIVPGIGPSRVVIIAEPSVNGPERLHFTVFMENSGIGNVGSEIIAPSNVSMKAITGIAVAGDLADDTNYTGSVSHVIVGPQPRRSDVLSTTVRAAGRGFAGETAVERITRLCTEENIPVVVTGDGASSEPMGPQRPHTIVDLLREAEAADGGILGEQRDAVGLRYVARSALYGSEPALTLTYEQTMSPLEPVDDDESIRNDNTVIREGGSSTRMVKYDGPLSIQPPPNGVGVYAEETTLNLADDFQTLDQAGWRTFVGTWDEARYPTVGVMLHKHKDLIPAVTAVDSGAHVRLTDMPEWLPPGDVDLMALGYTETIAPYRWELQFNAVPQGPYQIGTLDDPVLGRLDTDGGGLAAPLSETDTTLVTSAAAGPPWTEDPAEYPFDLVLDWTRGGEIVRATSATKGTYDTFDRTSSNGWGTSPEGLVWTTLGGVPADYSTAGGIGRHSVTARGSDRTSLLGQFAAGLDLEATFRTVVAPITGGSAHFYLETHFNLAEFRWYAMRISLNPNGTIGAVLETGFPDFIPLTPFITFPGLTVTANAWIRARLSVQPGQLRGKVWADGTTEPPGWHLTAFDTRYATGQVGVKTYVPPANTNALPFVGEWGEVILHNPQRLTVIRGINGAARAHPQGTDVRLARPMTVGL